MRRPLLVFLFLIILLVTYLLHTVSTLISLLFEDASADAIHRSELPAPNSTLLESRPRLIPKIIHQTYINESIPSHWLPAQQSCLDLHPDYEYKMWTDERSLEFIAKEYPWFLATFQGYQHPIQRADAIRYFVLAHYGGVYIDLDDGCNRRLDPLLSYTAFVRRTIPTGISNDIMGAVPQHPFFLHVMESLQPANRKWVLPYITIMASTGPLFLSVMWKRWMGDHSDQDPETWIGRVRVLMPDEYNKHAWSFFTTYKGSSWHGKDARFIFWLGKNWFPITVAGFTLAGVVGLGIWWIYIRILMWSSRRNTRVSLSKMPRRRTPLWRRWAGGIDGSSGKISYELVGHHDA